MREIDATTAADYLRDAGWVPNDAEVTRPRAERRGFQHRVAGRSDRENLRLCSSSAASGCACRWSGMPGSTGSGPNTPRSNYSARSCPKRTVPEILFEDRQNYLFAMTCAPDDAVTWKTPLDGRPD